MDGGLIYSKVISEKMQQGLQPNDLLRLASTFHSMHAISSQIIPEGSKVEENPLLTEPHLEGINEIVTNAFTLKCMQTHTGIKFIIISSGSDKIKD